MQAREQINDLNESVVRGCLLWWTADLSRMYSCHLPGTTAIDIWWESPVTESGSMDYLKLRVKTTSYSSLQWYFLACLGFQTWWCHSMNCSHCYWFYGSLSSLSSVCMLQNNLVLTAGNRSSPNSHSVPGWKWRSGTWEVRVVNCELWWILLFTMLDQWDKHPLQLCQPTIPASTKYWMEPLLRPEICKTT